MPETLRTDLLLGPRECFFRPALVHDKYSVQSPAWRDPSDPGVLRGETVAPCQTLQAAEALAAWFNEVLVDFRDDHRQHIRSNWWSAYRPCLNTP